MQIVKIIKKTNNKECSYRGQTNDKYNFYYDNEKVVELYQTKIEIHHTKAMLLLKKKLSKREYNYIIKVFDNDIVDRIDKETAEALAGVSL